MQQAVRETLQICCPFHVSDQMPTHTWKCAKCGEDNPPYTEVCRSCAAPSPEYTSNQVPPNSSSGEKAVHIAESLLPPNHTVSNGSALQWLKAKGIGLPTLISVAYFSLVMLILLTYEWGLRHGMGFIEGILLLLITLPGFLLQNLLLGGSFGPFFGCPQTSTCAHVLDAVLAGGITAVGIFLPTHFASRK